MNIGEIMKTNVESVPPDMLVEEVARHLVMNNLSAAPVTDEGGRILGIVTEADLLHRAAHPEPPPHIKILGDIIYFDDIFNSKPNLKIIKLKAKTAGEIMTEKVLTVTENAEVRDIATIMIEKGVDSLLVLDADKIVGLVTRHEIVRTLAGDICKEVVEKE